MSKLLAHPPDPPCSGLFSGTGIAESQRLGPDLFSSRARDPRGRPKGIPNPRRRVPDLLARPLGPKALSDLLDRKPHLLPALAA
jgi:hypothetical protein